MSLIGVTRRVKHKNNDGTIIEAEIGAYARNVSEDEDHRFVTDKEKEEWSNKVNASGGDISNVKVSQFETNSTSWPVPTAGETVKVILGKIKKHLEDLASWRPTVSLIANIVDNCTSTNTDKPLSAKQGKVLQDQITQVNSEFLNGRLYLQENTYQSLTIDGETYSGGEMGITWIILGNSNNSRRVQIGKMFSSNDSRAYNEFVATSKLLVQSVIDETWNQIRSI